MVLQSPYAPVKVSTEPLHIKVLNVVKEVARKNPKQVALINAENPSVQMTYVQLEKETASLASFLASRHLSHKDVVAIVLPNCVEYVTTYLAVCSNGGAISGASAMFTDFELERQFVDSQCSMVVTDGAHLPKVMSAASKCPRVNTVICVRRGDAHKTRIVFDYETVIKTPAKPLPSYNGSLEDVAILPYSSGTTGSPKGVMLTHKNFGTMIDVVASHFDHNAVPLLNSDGDFSWEQQHLLLMLPFYHIYGFGLINMCLSRGSTGIILSKFDPMVFLNALEKYKVELLMLVPPILLFMTKHPAVMKFDLSHMKMIMTGAAPLGREVCEEFYSKFKNVKVIAQGYGMTECGMASHLPSFALSERKNFTTVGYIASTFEQKIIDPSTGKEVPSGQRGEICVRGPTVMKGYLNRPEATAETIDKDGWLHTGDIGYVDDRGLTYIVDRMKELIKVKGLQVPPAELEDILLGHPEIADAAVIGLPDPKTGEKPKAFIVKASKTLTERDVEKFVEEKVSSYKWLTGGVEFISEIPKSAAGKILRRELRERHKAKL